MLGAYQISEEQVKGKKQGQFWPQVQQHGDECGTSVEPSENDNTIYLGLYWDTLYWNMMAPYTWACIETCTVRLSRRECVSAHAYMFCVEQSAKVKTYVTRRDQDVKMLKLPDQHGLDCDGC